MEGVFGPRRGGRTLSDLLEFTPLDNVNKRLEEAGAMPEGRELAFEPLSGSDGIVRSDEEYNLVIDAVTASARCLNALSEQFEWSEEEAASLEHILEALVEFGQSFVLNNGGTLG